MTDTTYTGHDSVPCDACRTPGLSCGFAAVAAESLPCACGCGRPTNIRSLCGAPRIANCPGGSFTPTMPLAAPSGPPAARTGRASSRAAQQRQATDAAIGRLVAGEPLRMLDALEGPFAPLLFSPERGRRSLPFWRPELPAAASVIQVISGYRWQRPFTGPVVVLDRSGAWIAAASSAEVVHGGFRHTGEADYDGRPGYYQVQVYPWYEKGLPSPLGHHKPGTTAWVMQPTIHLLRRLVHQGRWADVDVLDSWTGEGARLQDWTGHLNTIRGFAITQYGRDSVQYGTVKTSIGEAMSLLRGTVVDGVRRIWRCTAARPDWTQTWESQASATLWGWADDCLQVAPELAPVALRNIDELVLPEGALEIVTSTPRSGGRTPLRLDSNGVKLGTFKVKTAETWPTT